MSQQGNLAAHTPPAASQGQPWGRKSSPINNHYTIYGGVGGPGGSGVSQGRGGSGGTGEGNILQQHFGPVQNVTTVNVGQRGEYVEGEERAKLINWLSPINFFVRQEEIFRTRQENTGGWILEDPLFKEWETSTNDEILWCTGMPGAGKTVLASIVVDYLRSKGNGGNSAAACLYLNHKELQTQTLENLFAGLWRQLVVKKPIPKGSLERKLYKDYLEMGTRPRISDIRDVLHSAVAQCFKVYLVIDALDEYPDDLRMTLLRDLTTMGPKVKLMFTLRPNVNPHILARKLVTVEICGSDEDIQTFVVHRIQGYSRLSLQVKHWPKLQEQIVAKIRGAAGGMFLLAKLHIESLATKHNLDSIEQALENLPTKLEDAYKDTMDRIRRSEEDKELALGTLTWVAKAKRPLTVVELQDALAIELNSDALNPRRRTDISIILGVCAGLVIVAENSSVVRLVHFTTQTYLDSYFTQGHTYITRMLLTYLAFDNLKTSDGVQASSANRQSYDLEWAPLIAYASHCVYHAAKQSEEKTDDKVNSLRDMIITFLGQPHRYAPLQWYARVWYGTQLWSFRDWPTFASPLWVAAAVNLVEIARHVLAQGASPNSTGFEYISALGVASYYGHMEIVQLLLENGATSNPGGVSPLQLACAERRVDIVRILLEKNFDVNAAAGRYPSPLESAVSTGPSRRIAHPEIKQLLRAAGAHRRETGRKALQIASENGQVEMVSYLLKDSERDEWGEPLKAASKRGHIDITKMLLDKCANLSAVNRSGALAAALEAASREGHIDMAKMILDKVPDLDSVNHNSGLLTAALTAASKGGHIDMAKLLLDKGAKLDADGHALTAALKGHIDLAKTFLDKVTNLDAVSRFAITSALAAASRRGHIDMAKMLLDKFADLDTVEHYSDVLMAALEAAPTGGHNDMVKMLLDKITDLDAVEHYSDALTAGLEAALRGGHIDIAEMLLDKITDLDAVLEAASWGGDFDMAKLLIDKGVRPDGHALRAAAGHGHTALVGLLLECGAEVNDVSGQKPEKVSSSLKKAVEHGHADNVRLLLGRQAKFDDQLLQVAVAGGFVDIVDSLLKAGADPNAEVAFREDTSLETAVIAGNKYIVQMLLDHGAKPRPWCSSRAPLVVAASEGDLDIIQLLMQKGGEIYRSTSSHFDWALQAARNGGNEAVVDFLWRYEQHMA